MAGISTSERNYSNTFSMINDDSNLTFVPINSTWGPIMEPTIINSIDELQAVFGEETETDAASEKGSSYAYAHNLLTNGFSVLVERLDNNIADETNENAVWQTATAIFTNDEDISGLGNDNVIPFFNGPKNKICELYQTEKLDMLPTRNDTDLPTIPDLDDRLIILDSGWTKEQEKIRPGDNENIHTLFNYCTASTTVENTFETKVDSDVREVGEADASYACYIEIDKENEDFDEEKTGFKYLWTGDNNNELAYITEDGELVRVEVLYLYGIDGEELGDHTMYFVKDNIPEGLVPSSDDKQILMCIDPETDGYITNPVYDPDDPEVVLYYAPVYVPKDEVIYEREEIEAQNYKADTYVYETASVYISVNVDAESLYPGYYGTKTGLQFILKDVLGKPTQRTLYHRVITNIKAKKIVTEAAVAELSFDAEAELDKCITVTKTYELNEDYYTINAGVSIVGVPLYGDYSDSKYSEAKYLYQVALTGYEQYSEFQMDQEIEYGEETWTRGKLAIYNCLTYDAEDITSHDLTDTFMYDIKFVTTGGYNDDSGITQRAAATVANTRKDCIAFVDYPLYASYGSTESIRRAKDIKPWVLEKLIEKGLDSSYSTIFAPWCIGYDSIDEENTKYLAPSLIYLRTLATSVYNGTPVYTIPVGVRRGNVSDITPVFQVGGGLLDSWQAEGNQFFINPIMRVKSYGYCIFGQRTLLVNQAGTVDLLQELGVRTTLNEIKRYVNEVAISLTYEPNNARTWNSFEVQVSEYLDGLVTDEALMDYSIYRTSTTYDTNKIEAVIRLYLTRMVEYFDITFEIYAGESSTATEQGEEEEE